MDPRTVVLTTAAIPAVLASVMVLVRGRHRVYPGFGAWTASQVAFAAGGLLIGFRDELPLLLSVVAGNALVLGSLWLVLEGLVRFHGLRRLWAPAWDVIGMAFTVVLFAAVTAAGAPAQARIVLAEGVSAFLVLRAALEPLRSPRARASATQRALSALLGLTAAVSLARVARVLAAPDLDSTWGEGPQLVVVALFYALANLAQVFAYLHLNLERAAGELREAVEDVQTLARLLPICASCKKIRDDEGYWQQLEGYLARHAGLAFTHGICEACAARLYPEADLPGPAEGPRRS